MSLPVSLCVLRIELSDDDLNMESEKYPVSCGAMAAAENDKVRVMRGRREMRDITIETYSNDKEGTSGLLPGSENREKTSLPLHNKEADLKLRRSCEPDGLEVTAYKPRDQISFISGNPFVEVTKGVLHLFKEDEHTSMERAAQRSQTVCILAVPAAMTCHDLLTFTAACHGDIQHLRIVRDGSPNQYMGLLTFRTQQAASEFYSTFNGAPYNSLEPECCCHLVFVSRVELVREGDDGAVPPAGHTELPTCPVCLERMDESVDGILTILCNHAFHSSCLAKWGDTSCPVCRYIQTPELVADNRCLECHSADSLWICLICGHVGCGRYVQGHAFQHYLQTQHCYSMQLGNNRVWDYVGDNFVHRLLQNKGDGKLVEGSAPNKIQEEKMDSVQLEFTYLLTSQLDSQRVYFEELLSRKEQQALVEIAEVKDKANKTADENDRLLVKLTQLTKEKQIGDKKLQQLLGRVSATQSELTDERQMSRALRQNQSEWQAKFSALEKQFADYKTSKDKELADVREQLQDVMFFLDAQQKISQSADRDEIAAGRIVIGDAPTPAPTNTSNSKNHRRRKHR